jgi:hypothetical protein
MRALRKNFAKARQHLRGLLSVQRQAEQATEQLRLPLGTLDRRSNRVRVWDQLGGAAVARNSVGHDRTP